jgi:segregation and condensation protein A
VSTQVAGFHTDKYTVTTPVYAGPLDLLLDLIERAELDITNVALAAVTDQYLAYLRTIEDRDPAEVSAFLVIAAKLVQIKSEALLPRPVVRQEGEEDLGESLARQLLTYRRFKQIAGWLNEREEANVQTFLHVPPDIQIDGRVDLSNITLADLVAAARVVYAPRLTKPLLSTVVSIPLITIRNKISSIIRALKERGHLTFSGVLGGSRSRIDVVVTFLAMLELIKRHVISTRQDSVFAEIELESAGEFIDSDDFPLDLSE